MASDLISDPGPGTAIPARVLSQHRLTPWSSSRDLRHLVLAPASKRWVHREGQYVGLSLPQAGALGQAYFSIASAPDSGELALLVKLADEDAGTLAVERTRAIAALMPGDEVLLNGPHGDCFLPPQGDAPMLLAATGTGIAPMRATLQALARQPRGGRRWLFFGARNPDEAAYVDELGALPPDVAQVRFAWSRHAGESPRYVQDDIRDAAKDIQDLLQNQELSVCVCGIPAMEAEVERALEEICVAAGLRWTALRSQLQARGRLHIQTY